MRDRSKPALSSSSSSSLTSSLQPLSSPESSNEGKIKSRVKADVASKAHRRGKENTSTNKGNVAIVKQRSKDVFPDVQTMIDEISRMKSKEHENVVISHYDLRSIKCEPAYRNQEKLKLTEDEFNEIMDSLTVGLEKSTTEKISVCLKILIKVCMDVYNSQETPDIENLMIIFWDLLESPFEESRVYAFELIFNLALHVSLNEPNSCSTAQSDWIFRDLQTKLISMISFLVESAEDAESVWKTAVKAYLIFLDCSDNEILDVENAHLLIALSLNTDDISFEASRTLIAQFTSIFYTVGDGTIQLDLQRVAQFGGPSSFLTLMREQIDEQCKRLIFNIIYDYALHDLESKFSVLPKDSKIYLNLLMSQTSFWNIFWNLLFHVPPKFVESSAKHFVNLADASTVAKSHLIAFLYSMEQWAINFSKPSETMPSQDIPVAHICQLLKSQKLQDRHVGQLLLCERVITNNGIQGSLTDKLVQDRSAKVRKAILDTLYTFLLRKIGQTIKIHDIVNVYFIKYVNLKEPSQRILLAMFHIILCTIGEVQDYSDLEVAEILNCKMPLSYSRASLNQLEVRIVSYLFGAICGRSHEREKLMCLSLLLGTYLNHVEPSEFYDMAAQSRDPKVCYMVSRFLVDQIKMEEPKHLENHADERNPYVIIQDLLIERKSRARNASHQ